MEDPWMPGQDVWRFRPSLRYSRQSMAVCLGFIAALGVMLAFNDIIFSWWIWFGFAVSSLSLGVVVMAWALRWADKPALTISWDGLGLGSWGKAIPWSAIETLRGDGPVSIVLRSGTVLHCPWWGLDPQQRPVLVDVLQAKMGAWRQRGPLSLPVARWTMQTDRLALRPWCTHDIRVFHRIHSDPRLLRFQDYPPLSVDQARHRLAQITRVEDRPEAYSWTRAIVYQRSGLVVGHLDIWISCVSLGIASFGYGILPDHQRRGLMTELVIELAPMVIEKWGVTQLEAKVRRTNQASQGVLLKAGFVKHPESDDPGIDVWQFSPR